MNIDSFLYKTSSNKIKYFNTNILEIDNFLQGGFPKGRLIEITGSYDVGKTFMLFDILKNLDEDKIALYISTSSNSLQYLKYNKLDLKENILILVSNEERKIIDSIKKMVEYVDLIIIDSISEILTSNEAKNMNLSIQQDIPKLLRDLNSATYNKNAVVLLVNYMTYKNSVSISKWNAYFEQYCSVRLKVNQYNSNIKSINVLSHKLKPNIIGEKMNVL